MATLLGGSALLGLGAGLPALFGILGFSDGLAGSMIHNGGELLS